jgi:hypothetical protein
MKSIVVAVVVLVGSAILGSSVWAQNWVSSETLSPEIASGKNVTLRGSLSGKAANSTPGACTGGNATFANQCPTGHTCICTQVQGANFSSNLTGKGHADVFITIDTSAGFGLPTPTQPPSPECFPIVGEIDVIAKKDSETLEGTGAECAAPRNVQLSGAFALAASNLFTVGFANFTVNLESNGAFKMTFKGAAQAK